MIRAAADTLSGIRLPIRTRRWDDAIAKLDAERDAEEIVRILANHVFPLEFLVSLEMAQLRTFTIPSISAILHSTGQYEREGQKRLDDTRAILTEIHRPGLDTGESREMVEHLNRIHGLYAISNDDFLYVLSTFVFDPALFIDRWGHRRLTERERDALHFLNVKVGRAMGIEDVPPTRSAFLEWRRAYEARAQRPAPENTAVAHGMLRAVGGMFPRALASLWEPLTVVLLNDTALQGALGLSSPRPELKRAFGLVAAAYRVLTRHVNPFEHVAFWDTEFFRRFESYPQGYQRLRLGPKKVIAFLEKAANGSAAARSHHERIAS